MTEAGRRGRRPRRSRYRAGELVRFKTAAQIAATLDEQGTLDGLPFMPEMTSLCGRTFQVRSSAHKTCDSVMLSGMRGMDATAHLQGLHCDGAAHGGCQSRCPLFVKDEWLEPAAGDSAGHDPVPAATSDELTRKAGRSVFLHDRDPAAGTYSCQGTEVLAATVPLPGREPRQYWDDVRSGNVTVSALVRGLLVIAFNVYQRLSTRLLPPPLRIRGGRRYPDVSGHRETTPDTRLGLAAGEQVEVRSHADILDTLDATARNRGLGFDTDMVPFCGQRRTVHHRVEVRIDERTGELRHMTNPCVVLDGVVCRGLYHRFCPRGIDAYWREAWLRRPDPPGTDPDAIRPARG